MIWKLLRVSVHGVHTNQRVFVVSDYMYVVHVQEKWKKPSLPYNYKYSRELVLLHNYQPCCPVLMHVPR